MDENFTTDLQAFSERLAKLRIQKGVSARIMSFELGQNKNYVANIESGKAYPTLASFLNICSYFSITPAEFFDYDNSRPVENNDLITRYSMCSDERRALISKLIDELK